MTSYKFSGSSGNTNDLKIVTNDLEEALVRESFSIY